MNEGDLAIEKGDTEIALSEYSAAEAMYPDNLEMQFWHAIALTNCGRLEDALPIFGEVFARDANWLTLAERLVPIGSLNASDEDMTSIRSRGGRDSAG